MSPTAVAISEKIMHLDEAQLAKVDNFVESLQLRRHNALVKASMAMSEPSFEAIWSNPEDDVYDAL
jgi:hypothetical protein